MRRRFLFHIILLFRRGRRRRRAVVNKFGHGSTAKLSVDGITYTAVADAKCKFVIVGSPWPAGYFTVG
ncbi:hypothetical protein MCOR07_010522 [Pyricularia oryzae]|nr:hypothetical protein MCOR16_010150 [Pyricularia oryzae]KAI6601929.1 hypothetical protein MCOR06_000109 [Pyricularia oryzae]KAI6611072.1 hypothetical protein MCOR07_010522 [Pyricularia oryzae]